MLTCKRRRHIIYIYDGDKELGHIFPSYSLQEMWGISTPTDLLLDHRVPFEQLFCKAFYRELDSVPNLRKKMKEAWDIKQASLLADTMVEQSRMPL